MKHLYALLLLILPSFSLLAQQTLPAPPSAQAAYAKGTRSITGEPGPNYWQNTANYNLKVDLNPSTREVKGTAEIQYFNNSPDTLTTLWFKLYPNLYKRGVERNTEIPDADLGEGVIISAIDVNEQPKPVSSLVVEGTNMYTTIEALAPGKSIKIKFKYSYTLSGGHHERTGQVEEGAYFVAYFFPRVAVYDDVDGWNKIPYKGVEEFYNDYGNFKAAITVPKGYVVWATGNLLNARDVLSRRIAKRLEKAEVSDEMINVIDSTDLNKGRITRSSAYNTWKFEAKNVTDFTFATSDHYVWQSSSLVVDPETNRRTRVDAAFNKAHKEFYEWLDFTKQTVHAMSYNFPKIPFPYPHQTIFDGKAEMEYPMMVNANWVQDRAYAIGLVDHEVFHTIFPFFVGTNESKHAWMDEGWAAMGEWHISTIIDSTIVDATGGGVKAYAKYAGHETEQPLITPTPLLDRRGYTFNSYIKSALANLYLKDYLGDALFEKALHHYISTWQGKHPMPHDFFYSMSKGSGKDLDRFWRTWFFEDGTVDMAITTVSKEKDGYQVKVENKGIKPLPIYLTLTFSDGSTQKLHRSVAVWEGGDKTVTLHINTPKALQKVELGNAYVPDRNQADNVLEI